MRHRHHRGHLSDRAEEILEHLWIVTEEGGAHGASDMLLDDDALRSLVEAELVVIADQQVRLTAGGREEARLCVRRHRLAERLLVDILDTGEDELHMAGCKFEHGLHRGLEQRVCTILGHPRTCPHGKPIPPGECCRTMDVQAGPMLTTAADLPVGERAVIAYLQSERTEDLRKLMAIGALPGAVLQVRQRFPSYLIEVGASQFGVDEEVARQIYVRRAQG